MTRPDYSREIRIARLAWRAGELTTKQYLTVKRYWTKERTK